MDKTEIQDRAEGLLNLAREGASEAFTAHLHQMSGDDQLTVLREIERQNTLDTVASPSLPVVTFDTVTDGCGAHAENVQIFREKDFFNLSGWFGDKYSASQLYDLPPDEKLVCQTADAIKSRVRQLQ